MLSILSQIRRAPRSASSRIRSRRNQSRDSQVGCEAMESRILLSAITGTIYDDVDSSGTKTAQDHTLGEWQVYIDIDQNGVLNSLPSGAMEPSVLANAGGDYSINMNGFATGLYRVTEVVQAGWTPTAPLSRDLSFRSGQDSNQIDFFNFAGGTIQGTVWNDLNQNKTREASDPGLAGWTVFLDINTNGALDATEPSTVTDADGFYQFTDVPAGDYEVTEIQPAGWDTDFDIKQTATVQAMQTVTQDFVNVSTVNGSISGNVWNDQNGNGDRAVDPVTGLPSEPGLEGWTIFVDDNGNGILDPSEISTTTDAAGNYTFPGVLNGSRRIREILPSSKWTPASGFAVQQTVNVRANENTGGVDFANFTVQNGAITGTVWNDLNRDGLHNSVLGAFVEPGLQNWTVYLDMNHSGAFDTGEPTVVTDAGGNYVFPDLQIGDYDVIEVVPSGWETAPGFGDNQTVRVYSGATSTAGDFANFNLSTLVPGSMSGTVWNDLNGNGVLDTTPTAESGSGNWLVFVDLNGNRIAEATEPQGTSAADGTYTIPGVTPGTVTIVIQAKTGWHVTSPITGAKSLTLKNGQNVTGVNFGEQQLKDSSILGTAFADKNKNGVRDAGEKGLAGIVVYLDMNANAVRDGGEPSTTTSGDQFFTPTINEAGTYSFTHLASGTYQVRQELPTVLSATPVSEMFHSATIAAAQNVNSVDFADVYRANEIHGVKFDDVNGNGIRETGENGIGGTKVFIDLNRNDLLDAGEPETLTKSDGSYEFLELTPGAYVVREVVEAGHTRTSPSTTGGILWPSGISNPAVGNVTPLSITKSLANGESFLQTVTITLPGTGGLTNMVDVFLLFDDTGSFTNNSPIVRGAFPTIMSSLQSSLPGVDLGFGVGRFEEYANFASEYSTGRPFILNQPIVGSGTAGYQAAIQAALDRTTPGYGGDGPETDIEALYQLVTGIGFDGNNNGTVMDSGAAGLGFTQLTPGNSGDVPSFASYTADVSAGTVAADGSIGGGGFRPGALPVILLATDIGFAYQSKGETSVTGLGGVTLPVSALTQTSRSTTPFRSGAGLQETVTGLNALGALVIGLGTNPGATVDPRQGLEALSKLTGATNQTTTTIANGTADPIAPGDPFYFQITSGFASSVATGVTSAIQNAVTNVAMNITIQASDPRVHIINRTGTLNGMKAGQTASFDIEFIGDGIPHRFDLQFVREGTNVVLGSIPVVLGTPVPGDGYHFDDLGEGEIELEDHFGDAASSTGPVNIPPSFVAGATQTIAEDEGAKTVAAWATGISPGPASETSQIVDFFATNDNPSLFSVQPSISADGTLTFTSAPDANGTATITVVLHDNGGTADGGQNTSPPQQFLINVTAVNDAPAAVHNTYSTNAGTQLNIFLPGVLGNDTDVDGDSLTAVLVSGPANGSLILNPNGSFTYAPAVGFSGTDSFTYRANDGTVNSGTATVTTTVNPIVLPPTGNIYFYVVDTTSRRTFEYDNAGGTIGNSRLNTEDSKPRGIATNSDGTVQWVIDDKGEVFVYNSANHLIGNWEVKGVDKAEGISVHGYDLWIVDRANDRVYMFSGGATLRSGSARPSSNFSLAKANGSAKDLVTDGSHVWVVNSTATVDRIFRYSMSGKLEGNWKLAAANSTPTGIALAPDESGAIYVVDSTTDRVYRYGNGMSRLAGALPITGQFALNSLDGNSQGIASALKPSSSSFALRSATIPAITRYSRTLATATSSTRDVSLGLSTSSPAAGKTQPTSSIGKSHKRHTWRVEQTTDVADSATAKMASIGHSPLDTGLIDDLFSHPMDVLKQEKCMAIFSKRIT